MTLERWSQVQALYLEAEALPEDARAEFLDSSCGGDAALRAEVEALLKTSQETRSVFERPDPTLPGEPAGRPLTAGTRLGPWSIERLVGRGGMGEVYEAKRADGAFELRVAIKLLKRGLDSEAVVARFTKERRILAQLDHPNIAHVLDAGVAPDGRPFLAMEYVEGKPITEYARTQQLPTAAILRLMITVCEAVQAAHAKRIVHRDLKPSNVLVTPQGQVKLLDFGIAKALAEEDAEATRLAGEAMALTPAYAAPEQLMGRAASPASDVYALGVILYQLLAERFPHHRAGRATTEIALGLDHETIDRPSTVLRRERGRLPEPQRLERLHAVSKDLDLIVLKTLHTEAGRRYASAQALADDLHRLLEERPVLARPDSIAYRVGRFARRNRRVLLQLAGVAAGVALLAAGALVLQARRHAEQVFQTHIRRLIELGHEQMQGQHAARAAPYFSAAYSLGDHSTEVRFELARALPMVEAMTGWSLAQPGGFDVGKLAYSPDEQNVLMTGGSAKTSNEYDATLWRIADRTLQLTLDKVPNKPEITFGSDGGRVLLAGERTNRGAQWISQVWDLRSGSRVLELEGRSGPGAIAPSPVFTAADPDLSHVVAIGKDGTAEVWDVVSQKKLVALGAPGSVLSAAFSKDGGRLVTGGKDGTVVVWDARTGSRKTTIHAKPPIANTTFFADGDKLVVSINDSGVIHLWDASSGAWLGSPGGQGDTVAYAALSPDGKRLATVATQGSFKVWDLVAQKQIAMPPDAYEDYLANFCFQPGGDALLTSAYDGVRLWSLAGHKLLGILEGGSSGFAGAYSPDGTKILTAGRPGVAQAWNPALLRGEPAFALAHQQPLSGSLFGAYWARFDRGGARIISVGVDGAIRLWDATSGRPLAVLTGHAASVTAGDLSQDGKYLATASGDDTARIWELESGKAIAVLEGHTAAVTAVAFSPKADVLATKAASAVNDPPRIWDVHSARLLATLEGHGKGILTINFSPDGQRVVTASYDHTAKVWDARSGKLLLTLSGHSGSVWLAVFSPDGARILTSSSDGSVRLWDTATGRALQKLEKISNSDSRTGAIFNRDGTLVAVGGGPGVLWNPHSGEVIHLEGKGMAMAFNRDETLVASANVAGNINIWSTQDGHLLASWNTTGQQYLNLAFSPDGQRLVTAGPGWQGNAYVWDVGLENRSPEQIAAIIACKSAWRVEGEKLVPEAPHPETCSQP